MPTVMDCLLASLKLRAASEDQEPVQSLPLYPRQAVSHHVWWRVYIYVSRCWRVADNGCRRCDTHTQRRTDNSDVLYLKPSAHVSLTQRRHFTRSISPSTSSTNPPPPPSPRRLIAYTLLWPVSPFSLQWWLHRLILYSWYTGRWQVSVTFGTVRTVPGGVPIRWLC